MSVFTHREAVIHCHKVLCCDSVFRLELDVARTSGRNSEFRPKPHTAASHSQWNRLALGANCVQTLFGSAAAALDLASAVPLYNSSGCKTPHSSWYAWYFPKLYKPTSFPGSPDPYLNISNGSKIVYKLWTFWTLQDSSLLNPSAVSPLSEPSTIQWTLKEPFSLPLSV